MLYRSFRQKFELCGELGSVLIATTFEGLWITKVVVKWLKWDDITNQWFVTRYTLYNTMRTPVGGETTSGYSHWLRINDTLTIKAQKLNKTLYMYRTDII